MSARAERLAVEVVPDVSASGYPGALLVVDAEGVVIGANGGWRAPVAVDEAIGRSLDVVLGVSPDAIEIGALQMAIAMAIGNDATEFSLAGAEVPRTIARAGSTPLALDVGPWPSCGAVQGLAVFVLPAEAAASPVALSEEPAVDPAELQRFSVDAGGLLDTCDHALEGLIDSPSARPPVHVMFRALHTLKANARAVLQIHLADLAHATESRLDGWRASGEPVADDAIADLRDRLVRMRAMVRMCARRDGQRDLMQAFDELARWLLAGVPDQLTLAAVARSCGLFALAETTAAFPRKRWRAEVAQALAAYRTIYNELQVSDVGPELLNELVASSPDDHIADAATVMLRDIRLITQLTDIASRPREAGLRALIERTDNTDVLAAAMRDLPAMFAPGPNKQSLDESEGSQQVVQRAAAALVAVAAGTAGVSPALRFAVDGVAAAVARMSWVPAADLRGRVQKVVSSVCADLNKTAQLTMHLAMEHLPAHVHRALADMLVHAVRNALDHGIESAEQRVLLGKPVHGQLTVTVAVDGDNRNVVATVNDDGAGVDPGRVVARAVERGLVDPDLVAELSADDIAEILFLPGFSTAATVTSVSGRGVGMDAIRALAEDIGGSATLRSEVGIGATLTVSLPLYRY